MILTKPEAETIQTAMVALNNICVKISLTFNRGGEDFTIYEDIFGGIHIRNSIGGITHNEEEFKNQDAFFVAYDVAYKQRPENEGHHGFPHAGAFQGVTDKIIDMIRQNKSK